MERNFVSVDAKSGKIENRGTIDYEQMDILMIEVEAADGGSGPAPNAQRKTDVVSDGEKQTDRQTETDRDRQRQTETDRDRQRQTEAKTEMDRQTDINLLCLFNKLRHSR